MGRFVGLLRHISSKLLNNGVQATSGDIRSEPTWHDNLTAHPIHSPVTAIDTGCWMSESNPSTPINKTAALRAWSVNHDQMPVVWNKLLQIISDFSFHFVSQAGKVDPKKVAVDSLCVDQLFIAYNIIWCSFSKHKQRYVYFYFRFNFFLYSTIWWFFRFYIIISEFYF